MGKNQHFPATLIAIFISFQTYSQIVVSNDSLYKNIKGNIIILGIEHSGNLFEKAEDGSIRRASLLSDSSGRYLCSILPEVFDSAKNRNIAFLVEGLEPSKDIYLDSTIIINFRFPTCLQGTMMMGCDTRSDLIKIQSLSILQIADSMYQDGLDGKEKSFIDAFEKKSEFDLEKVRPGDLGFFVSWVKAAGDANRNFEDYILKKSHYLAERGYYVIVLCGASHMVKIVAEYPNDNIGYGFCVSPEHMRSVLRLAKILMVLEYLASQK